MQTTLSFWVLLFLFTGKLFSQTLEQNIQEIRTQFKFINSQKNLKKVYFENEEFTDEIPSEGCGLDVYYRDGEVLKIVESDALSTALYTTEYYLKNNNLIFVFHKEEEFTTIPDGRKTVDTETIYEERVYYKNGNIIRHLEKGMSAMDKPIDYQQRFKSFKKYIDTKIKYKKQCDLLQGTWINDDNIDDWFTILGNKGEQYDRDNYLNTFRFWFDGRYLWFHNTTPGTQDIKYELLELTPRKLELQNRLTGEVVVYLKKTDK